jgi:hypothetical protein
MLREGAAQSWESEFVEVAAAWADANGIEYDTFREMGVPGRRAPAGRYLALIWPARSPSPRSFSSSA